MNLFYINDFINDDDKCIYNCYMCYASTFL